MLRLTTFGGLTLARGAEDLTGAATQRRRLALLGLAERSRDWHAAIDVAHLVKLYKTTRAVDTPASSMPANCSS